MMNFKKPTFTKDHVLVLLQKYWFNFACFLIVFVSLYASLHVDTKTKVVTVPTQTPIVDQALYTVEGPETQTLKLQEIIKNTSKRPQKTGIHIYPSFINNTVSRMGDYLIQTEYRVYPSDIQSSMKRSDGIRKMHSELRGVNIYNITTGEKYSLSFEKPIVNENAEYWSGQVVDDKYYYFGPGTELSSSSEYRIQFPPSKTTRIEKLPTQLSGQIETHGNYHYLAQCYEGCFYRYVDLEGQKKAAFNFSLNEYEIGQTERAIGFDLEGEPLFIKRNVRNYKDGISDKTEYSLLELGVKNPISVEYRKLIGETDLPEKISSYVALTDTNSVLLFGKNAYLYNLNDRTLLKLQTNVNLNYSSSFVYAKTNSNVIAVCEYGNTTSPGIYIVDIKNSKFYPTDNNEYSCGDKTFQNPLDALGLNKELFDTVEIEETFPSHAVYTDTRRDQIPEGFHIINE